MHSSLAFSASISEPEFRTAAHCDTAEDYARSKQGTFRVELKKVTIKNEELIFLAQTVGSRCKRLANNRYQWETINPIGKMTYQHDYFDSDNETLKTRSITVEYKDTWLSVVNTAFTIVGKKNVAGTMKKGFFAQVTVPLADIATPEELILLRQGKSQNLSASLFLKSFMRYISDGKPTPYEESGGAGLYQVNFTIRSSHGRFIIE
jgi:hypothetical protein